MMDVGAVDEARRAAEDRPVDSLVDRLVGRLGGRGVVQAVFGDPIERGEVTVIPVARSRWLFGGMQRELSGSGTLRRAAGANGAEPLGGAEGEAQGAGVGGGGSMTVVPVGYIEIGPSGATFRPIVEGMPSPLFLLAAGITGAIVLRAVGRLLRG